MSLGSGFLVRRCTRKPARKGYDNHHLWINSLTGNRFGSAAWVDWVGGWRHARKRWPENFRILKKDKQWRFNCLWEQLYFSDLISLGLDGTKLVAKGFILMQDSDPKHISKLCQRYIKKQRGTVRLSTDILAGATSGFKWCEWSKN